jgi:hypothetical protein
MLKDNASYSAPINIAFKEIYFLVLSRDATSVTAAKNQRS